MTEVFGGQTVTIVTVAQSGNPGRLGLKAETRTPTTLSGCRFRPMASTETPEGQTDVAGETWKLTAPPVAAALAVTSTSEIVYDGTASPTQSIATTFQVVGPPMPKYDMDGAVHHVTIIGKRQAG